MILYPQIKMHAASDVGLHGIVFTTETTTTISTTITSTTFAPTTNQDIPTTPPPPTTTTTQATTITSNELNCCPDGFCKNGGICSCDGGSPRCNCPVDSNFTRTCESGCDVGKSRGGCTCYQGATCVDSSDGCTCICPAYRTGDSCDTCIHCSPNPCANGGTCSCTTRDPYTCTCDDNYTGTNCTNACSLLAGSPNTGIATTRLGDNFTLTCEANTSARLTLYSSEQPSYDPITFTKLNESSSTMREVSYTFSPVTLSTGTLYYYCVAERGCTQSRQYRVLVREPDWELEPISWEPVSKGDDVTVNCTVSGDPEASVHWWYYRHTASGNMTTPAPDENVVYVENATRGQAVLSLAAVGEELDGRVYFCRAFYLDLVHERFGSYNITLVSDQPSRSILPLVLPQILIYVIFAVVGIFWVLFGIVKKCNYRNARRDMWLILGLFDILVFVVVIIVTLVVGEYRPDEEALVIGLNIGFMLACSTAVLMFGLVTHIHFDDIEGPRKPQEKDEKNDRDTRNADTKDRTRTVIPPRRGSLVRHLKTPEKAQRQGALDPLARPALPVQQMSSPRKLPPLDNNKVAPIKDTDI